MRRAHDVLNAKGIVWGRELNQFIYFKGALLALFAINKRRFEFCPYLGNIEPLQLCFSYRVRLEER